jgi:acyl-CoA dehydrogenase
MDDFETNPFRDYLKTMVYYNTQPDDVTGRMEHTYQTLLKVEPLWQKFKKAEHKDSFEGLSFEDHVVFATQNGDITEAEAEQLIEYNAMRFDSLLTDVFDTDLKVAQERLNPHSLDNAAANLTDYADKLNKNASATGQATANRAATEESTGDENAAHGYEPDGDVKMADEQSSVNEKVDQADFADANPEAEALAHRERDAESNLQARMRENHTPSSADAASQPTSDATSPLPSHKPSVAPTDRELKTGEWQDGLRRDTEADTSEMK